MRNIILSIICIMLLGLNLYSETEQKKPINIPEKAYRDNEGWTYYDDASLTIYTWYENGNIQSKGKYIFKDGKRLAHGEVFLWGEDGTKIMDEVYENNRVIKRVNYRIDYPFLQRPLNIPVDAFWNKEKMMWQFVDKKNSIIYAWYINGEKSAELSFILNNGDFILNGKMTTWFQNGNIQYDTNFCNDEYDGLQIYRNESGNLRSMFYYKGRKKIWSHDYSVPLTNKLKDVSFWDAMEEGWGQLQFNKKIVYYSDGVIKAEIEMKDNDYNGSYKSYYPSGKVSVEGQYDVSRKTGIWRYYDIDGNLKKEETYKDDILIDTKNIKS